MQRLTLLIENLCILSFRQVLLFFFSEYSTQVSHGRRDPFVIIERKASRVRSQEIDCFRYDKRDQSRDEPSVLIKWWIKQNGKWNVDVRETNVRERVKNKY